MRNAWIAALVLVSSALPSCGGGSGGAASAGARPGLAVSPLALDFGSPRLGETISRTITLSNTGAAPLAIQGVATEGATSGEFAIVLPPGALDPLAPGASRAVEIRFTPLAIAARTGSVVVSSADPARPQVAVSVASSITGATEIAVLAGPDASPAPLDVRTWDFGTAAGGAAVEATLYVLDVGTGNAPLVITSIAIEPAGGPFAAQVGALPVVLQPARICNRDAPSCLAGETCSRGADPAPAAGHCLDALGRPADALAISVRFAPGTTSGAFGASLRVGNDEDDAGGDGSEAPVDAIALLGRAAGGVCTPTGAEVCNGVDDDCDGLVDEGPDVDAACAAALGVVAAVCESPGTAGARCVVVPNGCPPGFFDLDRDPTNGCEYRCTLLAGRDDPDDAFADTNCDGVDGDASRAVFAAPLPFGNDAADGTRIAPVASLERAAALAAARNADLYVATGTYTLGATFEVPQGSSIYGGFAAAGALGPFRGPRDGVATLVGASTAVRVAGSTGVVLERLAIQAADGAPGSGPSVALRVDGSNLTLRRMALGAGVGGVAVAGATAPGPAAAGAVGANGNGRTGGFGGVTATAGGRGGDGALGFATGGTGGAGSSGAAGGPGGGASCVGVAGGRGADGAPGAPGGAGASLASGLGAFTVGEWTADVAGAGSGGAPGGSAAGGGGSGGTGTLADGCAGAVPVNGGGGGGGGGGGQGGSGGGGGRQGGASFGIVANGSVVTVRDSTIRVSAGGAGAAGGAGRVGGPGGPGGSGAVGAGGAVGGTGGRGGDGGRGGEGGCGAGGPSVGLVAVPATAATFLREGTATVILPASPAPGGAGACAPAGPGLVLEQYP